MSFSTISISREFPVINGLITLPNEELIGVSSVAWTDAAAIVNYDNSMGFFGRLSAGTGPARLAGEKHGLQEFFRVPVELTMNIALVP